MTGGINRRDAIRVSLGLGDRVALEREQQSAIDAVRGHAENQETEEESGDSVPSEPAASPLARVRGWLNRIRGTRRTVSG